MSGEVRSGWRRCSPVAYSQQFSAPQVDINGIEEGKNQLGIVNWQIMGLSTHYRHYVSSRYQVNHVRSIGKDLFSYIMRFVNLILGLICID